MGHGRRMIIKAERKEVRNRRMVCDAFLSVVTQFLFRVIACLFLPGKACLNPVDSLASRYGWPARCGAAGINLLWSEAAAYFPVTARCRSRIARLTRRGVHNIPDTSNRSAA